MMAGDGSPAPPLDDVPDVVSRLAFDSTILYASRASETVFGRSPEELIGTRALDLLEEVDRPEASAKLDALRDGERDEDRLTGQVRWPDGTRVWTDSTATVATDPVSGERTVVVVTRRRDETLEAERALERLEERFRELVEWVPAVVYEADPGAHGRFHYVSPQIEQMLGYAPEEWTADPELWAACLHPEDRDAVIAADDREAEQSIAEGERMIGGEYRMIHRDGHVVHIRDVARMARSAGGHRFWRGLLVDVGGARSAELTLRDAQDNYMRMVDGLPACAYRAEIGHNGRWVFVSSQIERLLGYTQREVITDPTLWAASLHGDDRERVEEAEAALIGMPPGTEYVNEYRIRTRTGRQIWVRDRAVLTRGPADLMMMDGLLVDITAERMTRGSNAPGSDTYRLACSECGNAWSAERREPCPNCGGLNIEGVSLNATLGELAESRRQVEGLLDGIHRHLEALQTNMRSVSDQLAFGADRQPTDDELS